MRKGDIHAEKAGIRKRMLARRAAHTGFIYSVKSRLICARIARLSAFRRAKVILLYFPIRGEVDVLGLFQAAIRAGKRVAFPRMSGNRISFYGVESFSGLVPGRYGIAEPSGNKSVRVGSDCFMVVPGTAFSPKGARLGFGGGFYDRFINRCDVIAAGAAFSFQVIEGVPESARDSIMNAVVSEGRVYYCVSDRGHE